MVRSLRLIGYQAPDDPRHLPARCRRDPTYAMLEMHGPGMLLPTEPGGTPHRVPLPGGMTLPQSRHIAASISARGARRSHALSGRPGGGLVDGTFGVRRFQKRDVRERSAGRRQPDGSLLPRWEPADLDEDGELGSRVLDPVGAPTATSTIVDPDRPRRRPASRGRTRARPSSAPHVGRASRYEALARQDVDPLDLPAVGLVEDRVAAPGADVVA